jgi:hypothetical protein
VNDFNTFFDKFFVRKLGKLFIRIEEGTKIQDFETTRRAELKKMFPELTDKSINRIILGLLKEEDGIELRNYVSFDSEQFAEYCELQQSTKNAEPENQMDISF